MRHNEPAAARGAGILRHAWLHRSSDPPGLGLGSQAKFGGLKGVRLGHGVLRAVEAIEDQFAKREAKGARGEWR
jgi:hypothetical protein